MDEIGNMALEEIGTALSAGARPNVLVSCGEPGRSMEALARDVAGRYGGADAYWLEDGGDELPTYGALSTARRPFVIATRDPSWVARPVRGLCGVSVP